MMAMILGLDGYDPGSAIRSHQLFNSMRARQKLVAPLAAVAKAAVEAFLVEWQEHVG